MKSERVDAYKKRFSGADRGPKYEILLLALLAGIVVLIYADTLTTPFIFDDISNIRDKVKEAFPNVPVRITFTSNIIRSVWQERRGEAAKWQAQGIPNEILYVKNIIATFGDLLEEGFVEA